MRKQTFLDAYDILLSFYPLMLVSVIAYIFRVYPIMCLAWMSTWQHKNDNNSAFLNSISKIIWTRLQNPAFAEVLLLPCNACHVIFTSECVNHRYHTTDNSVSHKKVHSIKATQDVKASLRKLPTQLCLLALCILQPTLVTGVVD